MRRVRIVAVQGWDPASKRDQASQSLEILTFLTPDGKLYPFAGPLPVRRLRAGEEFWSGVLVPADKGWVLRGTNDDAPMGSLSARQLRPGEHLTLHEPGGREVGFQVVNVLAVEA